MQVAEEQVLKTKHVSKWVSQRARQIRRKAGLSQAQVAKQMGVHCSRVSDFERFENDFKFSTVVRFCSAMGIELQAFLEGAPKLKKSKKL